MNEQDLIDKFIDHQQRFRKLEASTISFNKRILALWLSFLEKAGTNLENASPGNFIDWLLQRRKTLQDSTVRGELCVLRKLHFFLYEFHFVGWNAAKSLPPLICEPISEKDYLSVDECFQILNHIDTSSDIGMRDYTIIALLWSTGLRPFELCSLQYRDINLEQATLLVRKGKGRKQRQIFLNNHLLERLELYFEIFEGEGKSPLFCVIKEDELAPFTAERKVISSSHLNNLIKQNASGSKMNRPLTAMTFRHTFATHMFESGVQIDDIKEMLGHDLDTESCVYIHVSIDCARQLLSAHQSNPFYSGGFDK